MLEADLKWYVSINSIQYGPYTYDNLIQMTKENRLSPSDLVWNQNMAGWNRADSVPGLFALAYPDTTTSPDITNTILQDMNHSAQSLRKSKVRKRLHPIISVLLGVLIFFTVYYFIMQNKDNKNNADSMTDDSTVIEAETGVMTIENAFRTGDVELLAQFTHPRIREQYRAMYEAHKSELSKISDLISTRKPVSVDDYFAEYEVIDSNGKHYYIQFVKIDGIWYLLSL